MHIAVGAFLLSAVPCAASTAEAPCPMYLAPSPVAGGGLGVFSGRSVLQDHIREAYEICPSIVVLAGVADSTMLRNYVFGFNETHSTISFGLGMVYNHSPKPHLDNVCLTPSCTA